MSVLVELFMQPECSYYGFEKGIHSILTAYAQGRLVKLLIMHTVSSSQN